MTRSSIGVRCAWTIVAALACGPVAAQPLPDVHDVYATESSSRLGPETRPLDRWAEQLGETGVLRYDFRLRIEPPDAPPAESSGRVELTRDGGRTVGFRIVLDGTRTTLVPAGSAASDGAGGEAVRAVDPERPAGPLDRIARYATDLPLPGASDAPATESEPSVVHFAREETDEHVYLRFSEEWFPTRIVRVVDGPTRVVLDLENASVDRGR